MASIDLVRSCLDSIRQISDEIIDSVIYLDAGCLEALHIVGAFQLLLELGVRAVCSLENMSSLDITANWNSDLLPAKKIVVITSHLLSDAHRYILRCLVTHQTILQCIIFTSISEIAHSAYADSPLGPDAFHEYESLLVQDYEELIMSKRNRKCLHNGDTKHASGGQPDMLTPNDRVDTDPNIESFSSDKDLRDESNSRGIDSFARLQVTVHHYPMILCPVSERVFLLPSEGAIAEACLSNNCEDSLSAGLPLICTGKASDCDDVPPGVTLTAHFLHNFASVMDLKMEIFSLGDTSKIIGKMLTNMSSLYDVGRRSRRSAGLLLVDRTLDLLTPCCHGDSFLDRVLSSLPRRKRATCLAMKSSHSLKNNGLVNVQHSPLDLRIPFSEMLSKIASGSTLNTLEENIKAFRSGWYAGDANSEAADLSDNADKLQDRSYDDELCSFGGCFLCNCTGTNYLEALLTKGVNDGNLLIKKWLMEALQHEKVPLKGLLGSSLISELSAMVKKLVPDQISLIRNKGILQLAVAAETVMSEVHSSRWDAFVSAERILAVSSVDNSQSLLSQLRDLITTSTVEKSFEEDKNDASQLGLLTFKDALLLSVIGYILAGENFQTSDSTGPFSWEEEHSLKEIIVDSILEKPTMAKLKFLDGLEKELAANAEKVESAKNEDDLDDQWGNWDDEDTSVSNDQAYGDMQLKLELRDRIDQLFKLFHKLSGLKWRSPSSIEGLVTSPTSYGSDPYARKGLLYKLLATVMAKYEIPGLEYHSSAVGRFFKSGFGRFGLGQGKPCPGDQSVLIVFVVGGINGLEIREAMEAISESSRPDMELIIGGTTLLSPDNMYDLLLGSSSYI